MSETLQSAKLSPEKHIGIFAAKFAEKTVGQCSKECCSVQRRLEMNSVLAPSRHGGMA